LGNGVRGYVRGIALMGKFDKILIFATWMDVEDKEFIEAATALDAIGQLKTDGSMSPKEIMDRIGKQISINRIMQMVIFLTCVIGINLM
jgi:hypothetical protein